MKCDSPFIKDRYKDINGVLQPGIPLPCGKCPPCKRKRVVQWIFRLKEECKISETAYFVTLTYAPSHVKLTELGNKTLVKKDVQDFFKRLRKRDKCSGAPTIKYYLCGEYGDSYKKRPHYHMIVFNVQDVDNIEKTWQKGIVHIGRVAPASIAYTLKYIDKQRRVPEWKGDDRLKEFSLMSKGLGASYLTRAKKNWHKADLTRNYCVDEGGKKVPMPKYYKDRIYNTFEKLAIQTIAVEHSVEAEQKEYEDYLKSKSEWSFENWKAFQKQRRYKKFYKTQKVRTWES